MTYHSQMRPVLSSALAEAEGKTTTKYLVVNWLLICWLTEISPKQKFIVPLQGITLLYGDLWDHMSTLVLMSPLCLMDGTEPGRH